LNKRTVPLLPQLLKCQPPHSFSQFKSAQSVVSHNLKNPKLQKRCFSSQSAGEKIVCLQAASTDKEGFLIAQEIKRLHAAGLAYKSMAVLLRVRRLAKDLEPAFRSQRIPYVNLSPVGSGLGSCKSVYIAIMSALYLCASEECGSINRELESICFTRAVPSGIGKKTLDTVFKAASAQPLPLMQFLRFKHQSLFSKAQSSSAQEFMGSLSQILALLKSACSLGSNMERDLQFLEAIRRINSLCKPGYKKDISEDHISSCVESIHLDLLSWMREDDSRAIFKSSQGSCLPSIVEFSEFILSNSSSSTSSIADQVTLVSHPLICSPPSPSTHHPQITIHQAKGLEFPTVFIPRFNEGTIPLDNRMSEGAGAENGESHDAARHVQEERRLAFVAISRAKSQLFVSWVGRSRFGEPLLPSRFMEEIPSSLITVSGAAAAPSDTNTIAFPQCNGPLSRTIRPLPSPSITSGPMPPPVASVAVVPAPQGFMGAFRKASDLLAENASSAHAK
jgi:DNA helicase-2/ATP-dependent DNA helicase PcrA